MTKFYLIAIYIIIFLLQSCSNDTVRHNEYIVDVAPLTTNRIAILKKKSYYTSDWIGDYDYFKYEWFLTLLNSKGNFLAETKLKTESKVLSTYLYNISSSSSDSLIVIKESNLKSTSFSILNYSFDLSLKSQDTTCLSELPSTDKPIGNSHIYCTNEKLIFSDSTSLYVKDLATSTIRQIPNQKYCARKFNSSTNLFTYKFATSTSTTSSQIYNIQFNLLDIQNETTTPLYLDYYTIKELDTAPIKSISQFSDSLFLAQVDTNGIILKIKNNSFFVADTIYGRSLVLDSDSSVLGISNDWTTLVRIQISSGQESVLYTVE